MFLKTYLIAQVFVMKKNIDLKDLLVSAGKELRSAFELAKN